jgi:hypothetical protein
VSEIEVANWTALYVATSICCGFALVLSVATSLFELWRTRAWRGLTSIGKVVRFVPSAWWRWQKLYLNAMPATLLIVSAFGASLRWN